MSYSVLQRPVLCSENEIALMQQRVGNALNEKKSIWDLDYKKISMTSLGALAFVGAVFCFVNVALGASGAFLFLGLGLSGFSIYLTGKVVTRINLRREDHRDLVIDSLKKKTFVEIAKEVYSPDQIVGWKLLGDEPQLYVVFEKMMKSYRSCMQMPHDYEKEYAKNLEHEMQSFDQEIQRLNGRIKVVSPLQEKEDLLEQRKKIEIRKEERNDFLSSVRKERLLEITNYIEKRISEMNDFFQQVREGQR